jgi:hypothetical protein
MFGKSPTGRGGALPKTDQVRGRFQNEEIHAVLLVTTFQTEGRLGRIRVVHFWEWRRTSLCAGSAGQRFEVGFAVRPPAVFWVPKSHPTLFKEFSACFFSVLQANGIPTCVV